MGVSETIFDADDAERQLQRDTALLVVAIVLIVMVWNVLWWSPDVHGWLIH